MAVFSGLAKTFVAFAFILSFVMIAAAATGTGQYEVQNRLRCTGAWDPHTRKFTNHLNDIRELHNIQIGFTAVQCTLAAILLSIAGLLVMRNASRPWFVVGIAVLYSVLAVLSPVIGLLQYKYPSKNTCKPSVTQKALFGIQLVLLVLACANVIVLSIGVNTKQKELLHSKPSPPGL